ncbi:MAG: RDD family protein [Nitrospiraceae bacterium]|nr:RDD family protein [Nitrospiraceae bacterium]
MTEIITSRVDLQKAGVGARLISFIIDLIIICVVCVSVTFFSVTLGVFFGLIFPAVYLICSFADGQTVGMVAMKIKLCRTDGTYPIGYKRGFYRWVGMQISILAFYLGFLWILIDKNKQGWHDMIADTYVVK